MKAERIEVSKDILLRVADGQIYLQVGAELTEVDSTYLLKRALDQADLIAMEQTQRGREYTGRCQVHLIHEDKSEAQCVLPKAHRLDDSDHVDDHGCHAPVLVHQSTIREVEAVRKAREAGLIQ